MFYRTDINDTIKAESTIIQKSDGDAQFLDEMDELADQTV
jgi:hypothetical protein